MEDAAISVKHVSKDFLLPHEKNNSLKRSVTQIFKKKNRTVETQHALKGLSFDIKKGEFFGILGRNGSGKSTLLKILAGIYTPTKGSVTHHGKLVPFIELGVGFNPELTGRENVFLNGALLGFSRKEIEARYQDIVDFAELHDFMDQKLKNYSSGMQVRLAFSVATRAEADILLVDEVLAVGDADFQRKCFDYFRSLKESHKTVVFVSHDMGAVRDYCDRAILINDGHITHEGSAEKVADEYLKLFNTGKAAPGVTKEGDRWGSQEIKFTDIAANISENAIEVKLEFESTIDKDDVVVGVTIEDKGGKAIAGTDTHLYGQDVTVKAGEKRQITFTLENVVGGGGYSIHPTLRSQDKITTYDSWRKAETFVNTKEKSGNLPVILPSKLTIK